SAGSATGGSAGSSSGGSAGSATGGAGGAPPDAGAGTQCKKTDDCRLFSSMCDSCTCIPLAKKDKDPKCTGTPVSCLVDPCQGKSPLCSNGFCVSQ
ncbi:MAG TPA: hypothetical protein PKA88_17235, partial [Polyangiaceae bacterium]|nr:hypothetical protein [Polyangiaceae bacterium]